MVIERVKPRALGKVSRLITNQREALRECRCLGAPTARQGRASPKSHMVGLTARKKRRNLFQGFLGLLWLFSGLKRLEWVNALSQRVPARNICARVQMSKGRMDKFNLVEVYRPRRLNSI